jgi:hypothetical protein
MEGCGMPIPKPKPKNPAKPAEKLKPLRPKFVDRVCELLGVSGLDAKQELRNAIEHRVQSYHCLVASYPSESYPTVGNRRAAIEEIHDCAAALSRALAAADEVSMAEIESASSFPRSWPPARPTLEEDRLALDRLLKATKRALARNNSRRNIPKNSNLRFLCLLLQYVFMQFHPERDESVFHAFVKEVTAEAGIGWPKYAESLSGFKKLMAQSCRIEFVPFHLPTNPFSIDPEK